MPTPTSLGSNSTSRVFAVSVMLCTSLIACASPADVGAPADSEETGNTDPVVVRSSIATQSAVLGLPFTFDATANNTTFSDPRGTGLTYAVTFVPAACGLVASAGRISGTPDIAGPVSVSVVATDATGRSATTTFVIVVERAASITRVSRNAAQAAVVGQTFDYDATRSGAAFQSGSGAPLVYTVSFTPAAYGLTSTGGRIVGVPTQSAVLSAVIRASDASGNVAADTFGIALFRADLTTPSLPTTSFNYADASVPLPVHFRNQGGPNGSALANDNTPANNITTNAGATLGRVLFYDRRLSTNDAVACASCHRQQFAFSDTARLSRGFAGGFTGRHSMGLANARFYNRGRFFWDERAASLEAQVLQPIQDGTEMGMTLPDLVTKVSATSYYPALFAAAFGTPEVNSDRISRALAQFVRSLLSSTSRYDQAFVGGPAPNFAAVFTADELAGLNIFNGPAGCAACHATHAFISDNVHNTGLDAAITDQGAGNGRFKSPSLRNIAVRAPYMHDGRFRTLEEVVDFYNAGVQNNPGLDNRLRVQNGNPLRLGLNATQRAQLVAFMRTLTDDAFLSDPRFANPFQ